MKITSLLQQAFINAQESKCLSYRVGAIIAKDGRPVTAGYNGTVTGQPNCDEVALDNGWAEYVDVPGVGKELRLKESCSDAYSEWGRSKIIHAEINAILFAAREGKSIDGGTMYCTMSPCPDCAKAIAQSGIRTLVYCEEYSKSKEDWTKDLTNAGVKIIHLDKSHLNMLNWETVKSKRERI